VPELLLLHGAGGSAHSFAPLLPFLSPRFRCLAPDLPGQGCSRAGAKARLGLDAMAEDLWALCDAQGWRPAAILGHSAGAAIALRMAELRPVAGVAGINAALSTFDGVAGVLFPVLARTLALVPFLPAAISRLWGTEAKVAGLLASTGSPLEPALRAPYLALVRDSAHVEGTLGMMAQWRLDGLIARLPQIAVPTLLIAAAGDRAVPAGVSRQAAARLPRGRAVELAQGGHLLHEEAPEAVAALLLEWLDTLPLSA
jgi:magnesium chelatase accessory protein